MIIFNFVLTEMLEVSVKAKNFVQNRVGMDVYGRSYGACF